MAIQCLESCFELSKSDDSNNPLNNVDLFELFVSSYVNIKPESKEEAEELKNEGNKLMKEEKYNEALSAYGR